MKGIIRIFSIDCVFNSLSVTSLESVKYLHHHSATASKEVYNTMFVNKLKIIHQTPCSLSGCGYKRRSKHEQQRKRVIENIGNRNLDKGAIPKGKRWMSSEYLHCKKASDALALYQENVFTEPHSSLQSGYKILSQGYFLFQKFTKLYTLTFL